MASAHGVRPDESNHLAIAKAHAAENVPDVLDGPADGTLVGIRKASYHERVRGRMWARNGVIERSGREWQNNRTVCILFRIINGGFGGRHVVGEKRVVQAWQALRGRGVRAGTPWLAFEAKSQPIFGTLPTFLQVKRLPTWQRNTSKIDIPSGTVVGLSESVLPGYQAISGPPM